LERFHDEHPLTPGMSLQELRTAVAPAPPDAVLDLILDLGVRKQAFEIAGDLVRRPGWKPALDGATSDVGVRLLRRLVEARWQVPTVAELEREFPGAPAGDLLRHLVREGGVEQMDGERFGSTPALVEFRATLEVTLRELGEATPSQLKDKFGLTRKFLIPLLEWADRRGVTRRNGDTRSLARLTAGSGGA